MKDTNKEIERLMKKGEFNKAFSLMLDDFSKPLYSLIFGILKHHDDTDDVLQNSWIAIWKNMDKFQFKSGIFTWCYTITKNNALLWLKKNRTSVNIEDVYIPANYHQLVDSETIWEWLTEAVKSLPEKQKKVFELKYYQDKTYEEIAAITQTSVGGLKASYHHAVTKITAQLKQKEIY